MDTIQETKNWTKYNFDQTVERTRFMQLLNLLVNTSNIQEKPYLFGRPSLMISDVIKCCVIKVYTNLSCRKLIPYLNEAYKTGIISHVPHYNSINYYMRQKWFYGMIKELIELSALPFIGTDSKFGIDATGFTNKRYKNWFDVKTRSYGKRKDFLKLNLICSTNSLIVPTVEVTKGRDSESPYFKKLITKTSKNFKVNEVYADKGYSSRENHEIVRRLGGKAYIPFRSNASGHSRGSLEWRMAFNFWKNNPDEFNKAYHRRSLNESVFSSIKRTRLNFIRSKNFISGKTEVLLKVLCHNLVILTRI